MEVTNPRRQQNDRINVLLGLRAQIRRAKVVAVIKLDKIWISFSRIFVKRDVASRHCKNYLIDFRRINDIF